MQQRPRSYADVNQTGQNVIYSVTVNSSRRHRNGVTQKRW